MNNQLDNLFKNKLEGHTLEPSPKAWSRVASGLTKKNKTIIWFRAAAALMITCLAFTLWYYTNKNSTSPSTLAQTEKVSAAPEKELAKQGDEQTATNKISTIQKNAKKPTIKKRKQEVIKANSQQKKTVEVIEQMPFTEVASNEIEITESLFTIEPPVAPIKKAIVIVYELKAVERIPRLDLDQLPERKTGLKKVLEVANEVRTGESPLGGLRQAKDEILAFNFKKDEKNNNK